MSSPHAPLPLARRAHIKPVHRQRAQSHNTIGKILPRTQTAAAHLPLPDDTDALLDYLDNVDTADLRTESQRWLQVLGEALEQQDHVRTTQARDALWGLHDKALAAGMQASDLPEHGITTAELISRMPLSPGGGRQANARPRASMTTARQRPPPRGGGYTSGSYRPCRVGTYRDLSGKCGDGMQAHHIVPDTLLRVSNSVQGKRGIGRIPGTPNHPSGPAICLQGNARTRGSEHNSAHQCDSQIRAAGQRTDNGPPGTLPLCEGVQIAMSAVIDVRPECEEEIRNAVGRAFPGHQRDRKPLNATGQPVTGAERKYLEQGTETFNHQRINRHRR